MKAINRRKAFFSSICLLLGAFCGRLFASELLFCILTPIASVAVGVLLFFLFKKKVIFILLTVFFAVGTVASVIDCRVGYDGEINEEGERFVTGRVEEKRQYGFLLNDLTVDGKAFDGKLLVRIKENEYEIGEELTLKGKVTNISHEEPFDTYGSSFYNDKIYYETNSFKIIDEKEGKLRFYEKVKLKIERAMRKNVPKENVGILKSLLFGDKSELVYTDKQMINGVGLAHIFAVSGLHVGFLVSLILFLLKKLRIPKTVGGWIAAVIVVFYGFLTGFPSGMKRVSVVLALQFLAYLKARKTDPPTTLALAGAIIVLFNPRELFDIGFVMSFVSVAGIVCYAPKLYDTLAKVWENRAFLYVAGTLSSTIAATLFIFPVSVGVFHSFSPYTVLSNLVILPIVAVLFPLAALAAVFCGFWEGFGIMFAPSSYITTGMRSVVEFFSRLPDSTVETPSGIGYLAILYYATLFLCMGYFRIPKTIKRMLVCASGVSLVVLAAITYL
ncbi:MAG: ComEC/Rec2 family competence protein [Clostridia bacterium]|nr:ComEC/Rec2 family competence protein [Clostridia bacterium]